MKSAVFRVSQKFFLEWMIHNETSRGIGTGKLVRYERYKRHAVAVVRLTEDELSRVVSDAKMLVEDGPKDLLNGHLYEGAARTLKLLGYKVDA